MSLQTKAFRFSQYGGPEVLSFGSRDLSAPGQGEIQIRHLAIGVNYIDVYHLRGIFAAPLPLPSGLGVEGVGEVVCVGAGVEGFSAGDRIAYVGGPPGAYSFHRNLPAARAISLPEGFAPDEVAATIFKGLTAEYLLHRCAPVKAGDWILVHAAAGGVGSILCAWASALGARVIGTAGGPAKMVSVQNCVDVLDSCSVTLAEQVRDLTGGKGVKIAFDGVGQATFTASVDSLAPRGTLVSFGESSGPVPPVALATLGAKGSLFLTRPSIAHYTADRDEYIAAAARLFDAMSAGIVCPGNVTRYSLEDAPNALADLEARKTRGSLVLVP